MNHWTEKDLEYLTGKGLKIDDDKSFRKAAVFTGQLLEVPKSQKVNVKMFQENKPKIKIVKRSIEKDTIHAILDMLKLTNQIEDFVTELQFDEKRKFRFDYAIPSLRLGIEYEGIMSEKSRHTTISGYSKDIEKYNLALTQGWKVLRYTAKNYLNLEKDLQKLIKK